MCKGNGIKDKGERSAPPRAVRRAHGPDQGGGTPSLRGASLEKGGKKVVDFLEELLRRLQVRRQRGEAFPHPEAGRIAGLFADPKDAGLVSDALGDPFFPLSLYVKHHMRTAVPEGRVRALCDLALLSSMFRRIRRDIDGWFGNGHVTCIDLDGDARQRLPEDQWCSFCGACCQLPGTIPDPPEPIRYPGYWYAYIAGDGPVLQRYCPFLFELAPQGRFFCAIHHVKPRTCLAFDRAGCEEKHPGKAQTTPLEAVPGPRRSRKTPPLDGGGWAGVKK